MLFSVKLVLLHFSWSNPNEFYKSLDFFFKLVMVNLFLFLQNQSVSYPISPELFIFNKVPVITHKNNSSVSTFSNWMDRINKSLAR